MAEDVDKARDHLGGALLEYYALYDPNRPL
jgi:hypothetical protein